MADTLDETLAQQGLNALIANPDFSQVYDGVVPSPVPTPPYVLVYTAVQWPRDGVGTALTAQQVTATVTYTCHSVGLTAASARWMAAQTRASLLNFRPTVSGRNCTPIKQDDSQPPDRDESTGRAVMTAVAVYSYTSTG